MSNEMKNWNNVQVFDNKNIDGAGYDADGDAEERYDADASQSSVQCSVSDHKLHGRVQEVATISDSDTEVEVFVSNTALVVTFDHVRGSVSFVQPYWCQCRTISDSNL